MSKSIKRMGIFATALAAALVALPLTAPVAVADPPRWAPAYGYRHVHGQQKFKQKVRHHKRRQWRRHSPRAQKKTGHPGRRPSEPRQPVRKCSHGLHGTKKTGHPGVVPQ